jgi:hypothetical protein
MCDTSASLDATYPRSSPLLPMTAVGRSSFYGAGPRQGGQALADSPATDPGDASQWWEAYCLAENDEVDELRRRAEGGDDHARRQLACWLAERGQTHEAVTAIRPLADAGEDVAQLWLARWLAESGQLDELGQRADAGNDHALRELAGWLATHDRLDELRELVSARDDRLSRLASWSAQQGGLSVVRVFADAGDDDARGRLARALARRGHSDELR